MKRELFEKDKSTVIKNARALTKSITDALSVGVYDMDEIARLTVYGCDEEDAFREAYAEICDELSVNCTGRAELIAQLCKSICFYAEEKGHKITVSDFFGGEAVSGARVAYVRNAISDEAYRVFSRMLDGVAVTYQPSFTAACEEVYYGRVPYCILPQENSDEGSLSGFTRLVRKYELYPQYICTVHTEGRATKMALLGREPCTALYKEGARLRLRVSFYSAECMTVSAVIEAAGILGLSFIKSESAQIEWDEERYIQTLIFEGADGDIIPFLTYLELEVPECSDKAVYYEIG